MVQHFQVCVRLWVWSPALKKKRKKKKKEKKSDNLLMSKNLVRRKSVNVFNYLVH
jgi:hypothetical protein